MIQPLEERKNPGEYINRVKKVEHDHAPGSRDFAYEIGEVSDQHGQHRQPPHEFGEDTYEHSEQPPDASTAPNLDSTQKNESPAPDDGRLDISV